MRDVEHAMAQLAEIRSQMALSTRFRGIAPVVVGATGILALAAAALQSLWTEDSIRQGEGYILFWTMVAVVAGSMIAVEALGRARRLHGRMADTMIGSTLRLFLPFGATGAILTFVIVRVAPNVWWLLPGLWLSYVSLLGFAAAMTTLPRTITWAAGWYFLSATAVLVLAGQSGEATPWMMGISFGVGQLLTAYLLDRAQLEV